MSTGIKADKGSTVIADGADISGHDTAIDSSDSFVSAKSANLNTVAVPTAPKWHTSWWGVTSLGAIAAIIAGLVLYFGFGIGA
ncbi:hypothetical protein GTH32_18815 [Alteromonas sp. 345S023]|uniref:Uncharacterized protein n=1 Tax=Alteromonas profundi TaxID=2696062 RepID=A0A7X5RMY8_9ALTE|nr:hypothetical protein [Alteromonas profundi]NDV93226.1 hypothetical protein [Alteromonas profundi]